MTPGNPYNGAGHTAPIKEPQSIDLLCEDEQDKAAFECCQTALGESPQIIKFFITPASVIFIDAISN